MVYLGVVQLGLAYVFLARAITRVPALEASLFLLVEPVLSPVWAWLVHGESPGPLAVVGGVVILTATAVRSWSDTRVVAAQVDAEMPRRRVDMRGERSGVS